jgi:hypothetical protein
MWFKKKSKLPGVERLPNGEVSLALTDEEQAEVDRFFRMMESGQTEGTLYIHPDAHKALTAVALIGYARSQVILSETADKDLCFRKALAAATKAYSLHCLPIYMFDIASIFELLGDNGSAQDAFRSFLRSQQEFKPSDVDRIALRERDVEEAIRQAEAHR